MRGYVSHTLEALKKTVSCLGATLNLPEVLMKSFSVMLSVSSTDQEFPQCDMRHFGGILKTHSESPQGQNYFHNTNT